MLGTVLHFGRSRGEDRFYNSTNGRRAHQSQRADQLRRAQSDIYPSQSSPLKETHADKEPENRDGLNDLNKAVAVPSFEPISSPLSNLECFLQSITPSVPAQYLSKTTIRGLRMCDVEFQPYFVLGDLWESFKEWSAYGAGVPLILNDSDSVVQYYVPYLSAIQIYGESKNLSIKQRISSRRPDEDTNSDFRDSSSDGSSDFEPERRHWREQCIHNLLSDVSCRIDRLSMRDQHFAIQEYFSSDKGESVNSQSSLLFEYLERDVPYSREPLADKVFDLTSRFPEMKTLRSCDLFSSSWVSVAWYPIYRIPTGPTLKDLDACFLTYHSLYTPMGGVHGAQAPIVTYTSEVDGFPKMSLPVFGLASYKFSGSLWTSNGGFEQQLANSLFQVADNWLRFVQVNHPDFLFFSRR